MVDQKSIGSRAQVMHGNARKTSGGLTKKQLKYNKQGKIVSRKASALARKNNRLVKAGYTTQKGVFGSGKMKGGHMFSQNKGCSSNTKCDDTSILTCSFTIDYCMPKQNWVSDKTIQIIHDSAIINTTSNHSEVNPYPSVIINNISYKILDYNRKNNKKIGRINRIDITTPVGVIKLHFCNKDDMERFFNYYNQIWNNHK